VDLISGTVSGTISPSHDTHIAQNANPSAKVVERPGR